MLIRPSVLDSSQSDLTLINLSFLFLLSKVERDLLTYVGP